MSNDVKQEILSGIRDAKARVDYSTSRMEFQQLLNSIKDINLDIVEKYFKEKDDAKEN